MHVNCNILLVCNSVMMSVMMWHDVWAVCVHDLASFSAWKNTLAECICRRVWPSELRDHPLDSCA